MWGYLIGLSSPSVTDAMTTLDSLAQVEQAPGRRGCPRFRSGRPNSIGGSSCSQALGQHDGVQVAARAGIDLDDAAAGRPDAFGVIDRFLVAFDHGQRAARVPGR